MSIKTRLLLLLLGLPMLLIMGITGVAMTQQAERSEQALQARLTVATDLLVPDMAEALDDNNVSVLESRGERLLDIAEVQAVGILAADGETRLELGGLAREHPLPAEPLTRMIRGDSHWQLQVALPTGSSADREPSWLVLDIDAQPLALAHYRRLASAGLGLLVIGLLLWLIAYTSSRRLTAPVKAADQALQRLAGGEAPPRVPDTTTPELRALGERVNALADHLARAREEMHRQVEQTTLDLQESMETIEMQNIELDMARRHAQEANRVKSEFLTNMSHEIRTPLNGIVGFCRLLGRSRLEPRQHEWLNHVQRACDNLLMLVNDVLDLSKMEAGRMEFEHTPLDMVDLVDEVLGLQAPQAHQKRLHLLGLVYDDVPPALIGDPLRIRQVLTNLVNNAIKFTERGEVIVRVMVEQAEGDTVTLRVSISDSGIGMTAETRRALFQAYRQATPSHSREFGGTGLGLTICRQLVEQMGGEIEVESEPGQGSTFSFTLPLRGDEHVERTPELMLAGETVLLSEPHTPTRRALRHLLSRWEAEVIDAEMSVKEARTASLLIAGLPHAALDTAGIDAWQEWLADHPCPALLLINATPLDQPMPTLPHGGELLSKPLSRARLAEAVERWSRSAPPPPLVPRSAADGSRDDAATHLLVVDDTESNRLLLRELIAQPGIEIDLAASGEEALAMAQGRGYDLVLMDLRMPGMDGVETTHALRRLGGEWNRRPIVAVTAHVLQEERRRLLASGLDDILIKPVEAKSLSTILQRHGIGPRASPVTSTTPMPPEDDGELAAVDLSLGARLAGGREPLARELLARLVDSLPESEARIQDSIARQDDDALLDAIHALNGACCYCGVPRLALLVETLETRLRSRGREAVLPLLNDLFTAMACVRAWQASQPSSTTNATASSVSSESDR